MLLLGAILAQAEDGPWSPLAGPLPGMPAGPFVASPPVMVGNPLLQKIKEELYEVPWASGEAVLLEARPGVSGLSAFGFWNGPGTCPS